MITNNKDILKALIVKVSIPIYIVNDIFLNFDILK